MLGKRSRAMASNNQSLKTENGSVKPTSSSSFFGSPRFFAGFSVKGCSEIESVMSPTSTLDTKSFTPFINPFCSRLSSEPTTTTTTLENKHAHHPFEKKLGLGIVDALSDEETNEKIVKPESRMVLLPPSVISPTSSPKSPADFGIKTRNSQLGSLLFSPKKSPFEVETPKSPQVIIGCLSASEMEMSEDYTCVISRGPNPKTIHIFGDCIVENCCMVVNGLSGSNEIGFSPHCSTQLRISLASVTTARKNLVKGRTFTCTGEKAFCSRECCYEEMLFDEGMEKSNCFRTHS
ncbi:hypothetical protein ACHQM5_026129 [Ranunculus cassubicifolius]